MLLATVCTKSISFDDMVLALPHYKVSKNIDRYVDCMVRENGNCFQYMFNAVWWVEWSLEYLDFVHGTTHPNLLALPPIETKPPGTEI